MCFNSIFIYHSVKVITKFDILSADVYMMTFGFGIIRVYDGDVLQVDLHSLLIVSTLKHCRFCP